MVSNPADKPNTSAPWHTRASSVLTALAHGSALFITTFLLIHLTAPAAVNLGGSAPSSQTMHLFSPRVSRPLTSALSVTGYVTAFCFLPRRPSRLSPSKLDYKFDKAFRGWPRQSTVMYSAPVLCVPLHAADGIGVIWPTWARGLKLPGRKARRALAGVAVVPVLTGLTVLACEPLYAFASMEARYRAALTQSIVYHL
ncbi:hypothetical protein BJY52DRAFT_1207088 [Lactarius psammicola]|nr:hypothetical protein BJY52DRAFT_1207088 [Lactarius psammicola]